MAEIKIKSFTDLIAWKEGHKLVLMVYKTTQKFPKSEIAQQTITVSKLINSLIKYLKNNS